MRLLLLKCVIAVNNFPYDFVYRIDTVRKKQVSIVIIYYYMACRQSLELSLCLIVMSLLYRMTGFFRR